MDNEWNLIALFSYTQAYIQYIQRYNRRMDIEGG